MELGWRSAALAILATAGAWVASSSVAACAGDEFTSKDVVADAAADAAIASDGGGADGSAAGDAAARTDAAPDAPATGDGAALTQRILCSQADAGCDPHGEVLPRRSRTERALRLVRNDVRREPACATGSCAYVADRNWWPCR